MLILGCLLPEMFMNSDKVGAIISFCMIIPQHAHSKTLPFALISLCDAVKVEYYWCVVMFRPKMIDESMWIKLCLMCLTLKLCLEIEHVDSEDIVHYDLWWFFELSS